MGGGGGVRGRKRERQKEREYHKEHNQFLKSSVIRVFDFNGQELCLKLFAKPYFGVVVLKGHITVGVGVVVGCQRFQKSTR